MNSHQHISQKELKRFFKLSPLTSTLNLITDYLIIILAIGLSEIFWHPALYILSILVIGARQHGLLIIGHDGLHFLLFKNKTINNWVTDLYCLWPILNTTKIFRISHTYHHNHLHTDKDPELYSKNLTNEYDLPKKGWKFIGILLLDLCGFTAIREYFFRWALQKRKEKKIEMKFNFQRFELVQYNLLRLTYYLCIGGVFYYFDALHILVLYWIVPFFTWLQVILRLRKIADHTIIEEDSLLKTGIVTPTLFDKLFILPHNFSYHLEHHLYPSVPFYRLPALHKELMKSETYADQAHVSNSFWSIFKQCITKKSDQ